MKQNSYTMKEKMWLYPGETAAWHFITLTKNIGIEIREKKGMPARGFGSLPVEVAMQKITWKTSIFPDKYSGSYILPVKAKVRSVEGIEAGDSVKFTITLL